MVRLRITITHVTQTQISINIMQTCTCNLKMQGIPRSLNVTEEISRDILVRHEMLSSSTGEIILLRASLLIDGLTDWYIGGCEVLRTPWRTARLRSRHDSISKLKTCDCVVNQSILLLYAPMLQSLTASNEMY